MDAFTGEIMATFNIDPDVQRFLNGLKMHGSLEGVNRPTRAWTIVIECMHVYASSIIAAQKSIELAKVFPNTEEKSRAIVKGLKEIFEALAFTRSPEASMP